MDKRMDDGGGCPHFWGVQPNKSQKLWNDSNF